MPRFIQFHIHGRPGLAGWLSIIASAVLLVAVVIVIAIVALSFLIFVLPVLFISGLISFFVLRSRLRRAARQRQSADPTIIEGEYSVVDPDSERKSLADRASRED